MHIGLMQLKVFLKQRMTLILFGVLLFLILLEIGLRLAGLIISSLQEQRNIVSLEQNEAYRIMCLGESTTAEGGRDSYPSQLEEILNQTNTDVRFSVINKGHRATNTSIILAELEDNIKRYKPNMVICMIGINDSGKHMPYEARSDSKIVNFLWSFKVYKLSRYLWLHIAAKLKESEFNSQRAHSQESYNKEIKSSPLEEPLKKAIELGPENETLYIKLGNFYRDERQQLAQAESLYAKALEINPASSQAHLELARVYRDQAQYYLGVKYYKKALELDPAGEYAYVELGRFYRDNLKYVEAEDLLNHAIKANPQNASAYRELAWFYAERGELLRAEELYRKAIEIAPQNAYNYIELGRFYYNAYQKDYAHAEACFKKAIEIDPKIDRSGAYHELGRMFRELKRHKEAEECFKKALEINPGDDKAYAGLAVTYEEEGINGGFSDICYNKAELLRLQHYNPLTFKNYLGIKDILDKYGIKLICVQYPMRSISPLIEIFQGKRGIIFVDNEKLFKDAVKKTGYNDYFVDMFAGDFGHCTRKGNKLLVEHIADTILKESFR